MSVHRGVVSGVGPAGVFVRVAEFGPSALPASLVGPLPSVGASVLVLDAGEQGSPDLVVIAEMPSSLRWKSASVSAWNFGGYANDATITDAVQALGVNVVNIPVRVAAVDIHDSEPVVDPAHLERALEVEALMPPGVKVIAEPYPWVADGVESETLWEPTNVPLWFESWGAACVEVAEAFPSAAMVYLGANMVSLEGGHDADWIGMCDAVRAVTSAEISYRCNWWFETSRLDVLCAWSFLSHLDVISVAAYFELTPSRSPDYAEVRASLEDIAVLDRRTSVVADLGRLSRAHGKPIFLGELNCGRCEFALSAPWNPLVTTVPDASVQAHLFRAYTEALSPQPWFRGWSVYNIGDFGDSGYRLTPAAIDYIRSIPVRG